MFSFPERLNKFNSITLITFWLVFFSLLWEVFHRATYGARRVVSSKSLPNALTDRSQFWLMHPDEISVCPILQRFRHSGNVSYDIKDMCGFEKALFEFKSFSCRKIAIHSPNCIVCQKENITLTWMQKINKLFITTEKIQIHSCEKVIVTQSINSDYDCERYSASMNRKLLWYSGNVNLAT